MIDKPAFTRFFVFFYGAFVLVSVIFSPPSYAAGIGCGVGGNAAAAADPQGVPCSSPPSPPQLEDPTTSPNSNKGLDSACDANFMNQIYAKALLEAGREMIIAEATIIRPDSVLEYSCFDHRAAEVARLAGPIFSELHWTAGFIDVFLGRNHLDRSIQSLVLTSLNAYGGQNFPQGFLAGGAAGDDHDFSDTVAGVSGACDYMYNVHYISKCEDFGLNAPFMTFESYFSSPALLVTDPRTQPTTCPASSEITHVNVEIAKNKDWSWASFDQVDPFLEKFRASDGSTCENNVPIPTGVVVRQVTYGQDLAGNPIMGAAQYSYPDKVCSNPACYFDQNTAQCQTVP